MIEFDKDKFLFYRLPYAIFESHISYMFDPCIKRIVQMIYRMITDEILIYKYLGTGNNSPIKTGYCYSVTRFKCVPESDSEPEDIPVAIKFVSESSSFILGTVENRGQRQIVLWVNVYICINKYTEYFQI